MPNIAKAGGTTTTGHSDLGLNSEQQHFKRYYLLWIDYEQILNVLDLTKYKRVCTLSSTERLKIAIPQLESKKPRCGFTLILISL